MKSLFIAAAGSAALLAGVAVAQDYGSTPSQPQAQQPSEQSEPATTDTGQGGPEQGYEAAGERG